MVMGWSFIIAAAVLQAGVITSYRAIDCSGTTTRCLTTYTTIMIIQSVIPKTPKAHRLIFVPEKRACPDDHVTSDPRSFIDVCYVLQPSE